MSTNRRPVAIRGDTPILDELSSDSGSIGRHVAAIENDESQSSPSSDRGNIDHVVEEEEEEEEEGEFNHSSPPEDEAASISFGALARAQASLSGENSKKRKRPALDVRSDQASPRPTDVNDHNAEALERKAGKKDDRKHTRLSKHAPTELSSKKAVSRKRSVVHVPKRHARDPRFESVLGPINEQKIKSNYGFLAQYRESEVRNLRAQIKEAKGDEERERLKREVLQMESRKKAQERKDAEQEVLRRHRKEERAKVEAGKTPFYLKKAEVKKEALVEKYKGMKGKEVDKLIERRRKKKAAREKKNLPRKRRVIDR